MSRPVAPRVLAALGLALLLAACGDDDAVEWRGATVEVPGGWTVFEEEETRLSMANVALGEEFDEGERPEGDVVGMFFTHEPGATPQDWRDFVEGREDAEVEADAAIELDGVPATRIVFSHVSSGNRTREMAVVVPARDVVVFAQPIPTPGEADGPEMFLRHVDTFDAVLDSIDWGAPVG